MVNGVDHVIVLKALNEIPFGVGRKLLTDFLIGDINNESIVKNKLEKLNNFGSLAYTRGEVNSMIGSLLMKKFIEQVPLKDNKFIKVLSVTEKGANEIINPGSAQENEKELFAINNKKTVISDDDKKLFDAFGFFLEKFNDEQKKAIVSNNKKVLCIAGAGSGKTTVLTKRIEFLIKYRSVLPKKILAITFTRKARQDMMSRLSSYGIRDVKVETFNSFCEKVLQKNNDVFYDLKMKVVSYGDKIRILVSALNKLGIDVEKAISTYFTVNQRRGKTNDQLLRVFLNDCFFIRDYFKFKNLPLEDFSYDTDVKHVESAMMVQNICKKIQESMDKYGLRDYADQLIDTIKLFKEHAGLIPDFDHVLIDEYQDVNTTQTKLLSLLNSPNLFAVGDPRQSIYGWRGSDIKFILGFEKDHPGCDVINLTKNYRSNNHIVELINKSISHMNLPDLEAVNIGEKDVKLIEFSSDDAEFEFVIQGILNSNKPRSEIFVLARTNKQLNELSNVMKQRGIKHLVKSDEVNGDLVMLEDEVTLATVHAIKGLEAETVFLIGCTTQNYPCRGSEHPVVEMVKVDEYNKEEEEKRLFYVAMSRAKNSLYISYSGSMTKFLDSDLTKIINPDFKVKSSSQKRFGKYNINKGASGDKSVLLRLQDWRKQKSDSLGVPAYLIMHDKTMLDLSHNLPMSLNDFNEIHGMGPTKIRKYGEELLSIIHG